MTPEARFERIERNLESITEQQRTQRTDIEKMLDYQRGQRADIDKMLDAAGKLIVVSRTCLDSIKDLRDRQEQDHAKFMQDMQELREAQAETDQKLNILIDTVDKVIRHNGRKPEGE